MAENLPEYAFYYPNPVWADSAWVKNLILFFDGVALLVPDYMRERPFYSDPAIAAGLEERGLLKILEPETFIDTQSAEELAATMTDIIASGALDDLAKKPSPFHELSMSRMGYHTTEGLARMIHEALIQRGLARESEDGFSIPMHQTVRFLILVLLAQILRPNGRAQGLELYPATDRPQIQRALGELLNVPSFVSAGHVVSMDLQAVGIDLSSIPLDEILGFRAEQGEQYKKYARNLRKFVEEIGHMDTEKQQTALKERQEEIQDTAADLRRAAENAWKGSVASFALGLMGAAWSVTHGGDPVSGVFSLLSSGVGLALATHQSVNAYSYLFTAHARLS